MGVLIKPPIIDNTIQAFEITANKNKMKVSFYFQTQDDAVVVNKNYVLVRVLIGGRNCLRGEYRIYPCYLEDPFIIENEEQKVVSQRYSIDILEKDLVNSYGEQSRFAINTPMQISIACILDNQELEFEKDELINSGFWYDWFEQYPDLRSNFSDSVIKYAITELTFSLWGNLTESQIQFKDSYSGSTEKLLNEYGLNEIKSVNSPFRIKGRLTYASYLVNSNIKELDYLKWYQIVIRKQDNNGNMVPVSIPELDYQLYTDRFWDPDRREFVLSIDNRYFEANARYDLTILLGTLHGYLKTITYNLTTFGVNSEDLDKEHISDAYSITSFTATSNAERASVELKLTTNWNSSIEPNTLYTYDFYKQNLNLSEKWEKILTKQSRLQEEVVFEDVTLEAGAPCRYRVEIYYSQNGEKYYASVENNKNISNTVILTFDDVFLITKDAILKLVYNIKITNLKSNILDVISSTLGGEYPFIRRNGYQKYKNFNIEALISYQHEIAMSNSINTTSSVFIHNNQEDKIETSNNSKFNNSLFIKRDKYPAFFVDYEDEYGLDQESVDILYEKLYREAVLDLFQSDQVLLYKSATEGNLFIRLTNVTLSPNTVLGRKIWTFNALVTEVDKASNISYLKYFSDIEAPSQYVIIRQLAPLDTSVYETAKYALLNDNQLYTNTAITKTDEVIETTEYLSDNSTYSFSNLRQQSSKSVYIETDAKEGAIEINGKYYTELPSYGYGIIPVPVHQSSTIQVKQDNIYRLTLQEDKIVFQKMGEKS